MTRRIPHSLPHDLHGDLYVHRIEHALISNYRLHAHAVLRVGCRKLLRAAAYSHVYHDDGE